MSWSDCTLGDVVTLKRGHDLPNDKRNAGDIPVVSSSGITGFHNEAKAEPPGVVTGQYGTIGEVFFVTQPYWPLNTALYAIDFHGNDPRFVSYFLRYKLRDYKSDKAAVPGVDRNVLHKLSAKCPDIRTQTSIVDVLSAYDDLIANNTRRIALLEYSARLLFQEWFVRLRYPGHEQDRVIDGVPDGWEHKTLGDVAPLVYGKALKEEVRIPGDVAVYGSSGEVGSHNKSLASAPGIVVGRKGNVGSVFWVDRDFWPIDTAYYVLQKHVSLFTYHLLLTQTFENSDAAVPGLNREYAHKKKVRWPDGQLRCSFELQVKPLFQQRHILTTANQKLVKVRDLLLPRLMDGRAEV